MNITSRFRDVIAGRTDSNINIQKSLTEEEIADVSAEKKLEKRILSKDDPRRQAAIFESIETIYFSTSDIFDPSLYELERLPDPIDLKYIEKDYKKKKDQLSVVVKKMSNLIIEKHPSYTAELSKVAELRQSLERAVNVCNITRKSLSLHQGNTSTAGVRLLSLKLRLDRLKILLQEYKHLRTLRDTDNKLRHLLDTGQYSAAVQLSLRYMNVARAYTHYDSISGLLNQLMRTMDTLRQCLRRAFTATLLHFDNDKYSQLYDAHNVLREKTKNNESDTAEIIIACAKDCIEECSKQILFSFLSPEDHPDTNLTNLDFTELLKIFDQTKDSANLVLISVRKHCKYMHTILLALRKIVKFHRSQVLTTNNDDYERIALMIEDSYSDLWQNAAHKIQQLISMSTFFHASTDEYVNTMHMCEKFCSIGNNYFLSESDHSSMLLETAIGDNLSKYFSQYHRLRLDELKSFLEAEYWRVCPIRASFSVNSMPEFVFLEKYGTSNSLAQCEETSRTTSPATSDVFDDAVSGINLSPKKRLEKRTSKDSDDDDQQSSTGPVICNTGVNVLKMIGRYTHIMTIFPTISAQLFGYVTQLTDYFLYAVCAFFAFDANSRMTHQICDEQMEHFLVRIRNSLQANQAQQLPSLTSAINLKDLTSVCGIEHRRVAVESARFIEQQIEIIVPHYEILVENGMRKQHVRLWQTNMQSLTSVECLGVYVYGAAASNLLDYQKLTQLVASTDWAIEDICSQHSPYVDHLSADMQMIMSRVKVLRHLDAVTMARLVECVMKCINWSMLDGYAQSASKCTSAGRARMKLDYEQLCQQMAALTGITPIPSEWRSIVDAYIRAYYMSEVQFSQWIAEVKNQYSSKQLKALITSAVHLNKKTRQNMLANIVP